LCSVVVEGPIREGALTRQVLRAAGEAYIVVAAAVGIVAVIMQHAGPADSLAAGLLLPVVIGFAVAALRSGARAVRLARSQNVQASVGRALATLGKEYSILARLSVSPGREDHVAIGPNGVFVVVASDDGGRVTASSRRLFVNSRMPWRDLVDDARIDSLRVRERVRRTLGRQLPVHSVLCFARALVAVGQEIQSVKIVHTSRLARLIASTPVAAPLSAEEIRDAAAALTADAAPARPVRRVTPRERPAARVSRRLALVAPSLARSRTSDRRA
jgi:hypothetical protein